MKSPKFYRTYNYSKDLLPNSYLASKEAITSTLDEAKENTGYSIGYPGWGEIYHVLLSHLNPDQYNVILETGTNWEFTTIILAQALKDSGHSGHIFTIELEESNYL